MRAAFVRALASQATLMQGSTNPRVKALTNFLEEKGMPSLLNNLSNDQFKALTQGNHDPLKLLNQLSAAGELALLPQIDAAIVRSLTHSTFRPEQAATLLNGLAEADKLSLLIEANQSNLAILLEENPENLAEFCSAQSDHYEALLTMPTRALRERLKNNSPADNCSQTPPNGSQPSR